MNPLSEQLYNITVFLDSYPVAIPVFFFFAAFLFLIFTFPILLSWLRQKQWKKDVPSWNVREDTPSTHQKKSGTPSMGGLGIIAAAVITYLTFLPIYRFFDGGASLALSDWPQLFDIERQWPCLLLVPGVTVAFAVLGFLDDWSKASGRGGLSSRGKLLGQVLLALLCVAVLCGADLGNYLGWRLAYGQFVFFSNGYFYFLVYAGLAALVIVAMSNAVNLTDGLDGLAAGLAVQACTTLGCVMVARSQMWPALSVVRGTLHYVYDPATISGQSALFLMTLAGASLAFLFFNRHPASVFMGDTGSLAIGAALGAACLFQHAVLLLPFVGFIFFVEMFSVIAQVAWFKVTKRKTGEGKRLFRRAPLHHHFELCGWGEWKVALVFWGVNLTATALGLGLWNAGILPVWP